MILVGVDREVAEMRERFADLTARLDPDDLPASHAPALWCELDQLARQVAAAKLLVARRVDDSLAWKREGFASAAEYLAAHGGTSIGSARKELDTSKALPDLPTTRGALIDGTLSTDQGVLIAEAAKVNPTAERTLVEAAGRDSFKELKDRSLRARAAGDDDPEATQRRIHRNRSVREYTDGEGAWNLHARGTAADGAKVHAAIAPVIEELFSERRSTGVLELPEARAFDALVTVAERSCGDGTPRKPRHRALVRCDLESLRRGTVEGEEVCEVAGVGPVPVSAAVEMLGEAAWKLLITRGVDVLNVTTLSRKATAAMLAALAWHSPSCTVQGCGRAITQIDHRVPYAETRHTTLGELDPLCNHHHDRKTYDGWALVEGTSTRAFVPPGHPRHPQQAGGSTSGDPPHAAA
jgi:Domain of unknown function (DUF222)